MSHYRIWRIQGAPEDVECDEIQVTAGGELLVGNGGGLMRAYAKGQWLEVAVLCTHCTREAVRRKGKKPKPAMVDPRPPEAGEV